MYQHWSGCPTDSASSHLVSSRLVLLWLHGKTLVGYRQKAPRLVSSQPSIYGAAADLCNEAPKDFRAPGKLAALVRLEKMEILTDLSEAENSTDAQQRWNLVQDYERRFQHMSDDQKLSKLFSDAGLRIVEKGQSFFTLDTDEEDKMQHLCREYTMPRCKKKTRAKGWILKNTRIGPVLDIKVCRHEDRYSIEVLIESLFQDRAASWVRIVCGIDKCVTEAMQTKEEEHRTSGRPVTKAEQYRHDCFLVSKAMTRLLRHDQSVPREIDGAVLFDDVLEDCRKNKFDGRKGYSTNGYLFRQEEEEPRKVFNIAWIQTLPATSCTSEKDTQEIMLWILSCKTMYCYQKDSLRTSTSTFNN